MQAAALSEIEREIIADIQAVCRRCGWPTNLRPRFEAYINRSGRFDYKQINALGGWKKLCALGGMHNRVVTRPHRVRYVKVTPDFDTVVADVRSVAQSLRLKPGAPLTRAVYLRSGGLYGEKVIIHVGGWAPLSAAAGVPSRPGNNREPRHQWQKIRPALSPGEFDAALDDVLGRTPTPPGILRMLGRKRCKRPRAVRREVPVLERGEIIADIRQVSLSLGLVSPRLLTYDTYRTHGGRYTYEQTLTVGGFDTLRRVA